MTAEDAQAVVIWSIGIASVFCIYILVIRIKLGRANKKAERALVDEEARHLQTKILLNSVTGRLTATQADLTAVEAESAELRSQNEALRGDAHFLAGLATRIRHDVPKRLAYIVKFIRENMPSHVNCDQLNEDIRTVVQKVELHLSINIKMHVRECMDAGKDLDANGQSAAEFVKWLGVLHRVQHRLEIVTTNDFLMTGKRIHWDLMITNILSNAIRYSRRQGKDGKGGLIRVEISTQEGKGVIAITNEGSPVPNREIDQVYHLGFSTKNGGKGLGLFVSREIAQGLGGDISVPVNSRWYGFGRRFVTFTISDLPVYASEIPAAVHSIALN